MVGLDAGHTETDSHLYQTKVFNVRDAAGGNENLVNLDVEAEAITVTADPLSPACQLDALQSHPGFDAHPFLHEELAQDIDQLRLIERQQPGIPAEHGYLHPEPGEDLGELHGDRATADDGH